jgi:hypothetical protein
MTQLADTAPGPYYISVIRESGFKDARLVSGPYSTHQEALDLVDKARRIAEQHDSRAAWYAFGTLRMKDAFAEPGILQKWGYDLNLKRTTKEAA